MKLAKPRKHKVGSWHSAKSLAYWKMPEGGMGVITYEYWSNYEGHYKGTWDTPGNSEFHGKKFDLPDVFFEVDES